MPQAAAESAWIAPDGHNLRRIDWAAEPGFDGTPRGSLLFLGGRGDAYEKYLETLHQWHEQGWRVTATDWRGQAGSGRLGIDALTGHVDDFSHWVADLAAFWTEWCEETPRPHVIVGHSMGGHLALRAVAEGAIDPVALVLVAPMLGFAGPPLPYGLLHGVAHVMASFGDNRRPAWKWSERPGEFPEGRMDLLTHDADRYADEDFWRERRPELRMGPASWGWMERAIASMRMLARPETLAQVKVPVLLFSTRADRLVSPRAIRRAARLLPDARLVEFGDEAAHELLRERDAVRGYALSAINAFFDETAAAS